MLGKQMRNASAFHSGKLWSYASTLLPFPEPSDCLQASLVKKGAARSQHPQ